MSKPRVIVIVGPTASGKTALAVEVARHLRTEIISADSRQFYRELPIGSAMPTAQELAEVKHHFVACRSVTEEYAAGTYATDARQTIHTLLEQKEHVVVCGGSGLYIQALLYGMDDFPAVTAEAKQRVEELHARHGIAALQRELQHLDPEYYREVDTQNHARLRRALEVCYSSKRPYSSFRTGAQTPLLPFAAFGLDVPKPILRERIHRRVDQMVADGLEQEARNVYPHKNLKALQTVGYQEFFDYFENSTGYAECIDLIKTHTRQYAKRQLTWFNRQLPVKWLSPSEAAAHIERGLQ